MVKTNNLFGIKNEEKYTHTFMWHRICTPYVVTTYMCPLNSKRVSQPGHYWSLCCYFTAYRDEQNILFISFNSQKKHVRFFFFFFLQTTRCIAWVLLSFLSSSLAVFDHLIFTAAEDLEDLIMTIDHRLFFCFRMYVRKTNSRAWINLARRSRTTLWCHVLHQVRVRTGTLDNKIYYF